MHILWTLGKVANSENFAPSPKLSRVNDTKIQPTPSNRLMTCEANMEGLTPTAGETGAMGPSLLNPQMFIIGLYYY